MCKNLIKSDLFRLKGKISFIGFLKSYWTNPGFKYMFWHRVAHYTREKGLLFYLFPKLLLRHFSYKFGFDIPAETEIGKGFYIGHFGGIVITSKAKIGINCNISQNVTIGLSSRGVRKGYPVIKNNVYIGPCAVIIGNITIGNNVAIGANAVVLNDVPDNAVVVGIPAKIVSFKGCEGYILNKVEL
jgi:serine O-acetyltransferase